MSLFQIGGWDSPIPLGDILFAGVFLLVWRLWGGIAGIAGPYREDVPPMLLRRATRAAAMSVVFALYLLRRESAATAAAAAGVLFIGAVLLDLLRFGVARGSAGSRNRVAIVGSSRMAMMAWRALRTEGVPYKSFAGFIDDREAAQMAPDVADRYLGNVGELPRLLLEKEIDELIIAVPIRAGVDDFETVLRAAGALGVRVQCVKDIFGARQPMAPDKWEEIFLELLPGPRIRGFGWSAKRAFDIAISALCLAVGWPILIAAQLRSMAGGAGGAFRHELVYGCGRRRFQMLALSSGANPAHRARWIDCVPQMWNVLRGEMSLVGPRPLSMGEALQMDLAGLSGRFSVRPGVTSGAWDWRTDDEVPESVRPALMQDSIPSSSGDWSLAADLKVLSAAWRADFRSEDARVS